MLVTAVGAALAQIVALGRKQHPAPPPAALLLQRQHRVPVGDELADEHLRTHNGSAGGRIGDRAAHGCPTLRRSASVVLPGEVLAAMPVVQAFTNEAFEKKRFDASVERAFATGVTRTAARAWLNQRVAQFSAAEHWASSSASDTNSRRTPSSAASVTSSRPSSAPVLSRSSFETVIGVISSAIRPAA